jgi:dihydrofolate synthase/folylpolyglutamate synthase
MVEPLQKGKSLRFATLAEWLAWQETLHPVAIDLGLERVAAVARDLGLLTPPCPVITVAGTNGKGSSVALLEAILRAADYRVGCYTSPHLLRYNERIRIDGVPVSDAELCAAFARVDAARGERSLTYFEFGTLAALWLFEAAELEVMVLEVGLGGRLDAVNILDADVALVTAIDIDHRAWLGDDRECIGREKAGIFRAGRPAVCGDPAPPASVPATARALGAFWHGRDSAFGYCRGEREWTWQGEGREYAGLPLPALAGAHQLDNAAAVIQTLLCLETRLPVSRAALERGLRSVSLPGRFQRLPGLVERVLDVAHNPQGGRVLAHTLATWPLAGRTHLVLGMLADKDVAAFAAPLAPQVDHWYLGGLDLPRGLSTQALRARLADLLPDGDVTLAEHVPAAYEAAMAQARPGDRVVVCGSFHTVAEVMAILES